MAFARVVFVFGLSVLLAPVGCRDSSTSGSESASSSSERVKSDDIAARVRQILAKVLKRNVSDIRDDSSYVRDLGADDLEGRHRVVRSPLVVRPLFPVCLWCDAGGGARAYNQPRFQLSAFQSRREAFR